MQSEDIKLPQVHEATQEELEDTKLKLLSPKQQRFVHLYLSGQHKVSDIAVLLGMSYNGVRKWLNNPQIKALIEEYQQEEDEIVKQGLKALQMKAMYAMAELLDSKIDGIKFQAAKDLLDRNGKKPPTKQEVNVEIYTFEQQMKQVLKESGLEKEFIEVDFKEVDNS